MANAAAIKFCTSRVKLEEEALCRGAVNLSSIEFHVKDNEKKIAQMCSV